MGTRAERRGLCLAVVVAVVTISACQKPTSNTQQQSPTSARALSGSLADPARLQQDDGQWAMSAKNYAATRFSALDEITPANVKQMGVAWTFSTGVMAGHEGPPLDRIAVRSYLGGHLTNSPGNMIRWIQRPQEVDPKNVMPNMGVTDQDARDIAAYLYTLR